MARHSDEAPIAPPGDSHETDPSPQPESELNSLALSQIYALVDSILPFEACLYYQVLPISIDGSRLVMGTVNPDDPAAVDYVNKQLSYINYSIRFEKISSDWHRDLLSKYLNHQSQKRQQSQRQAPAPVADSSAMPPAKSAEELEREQQQTFVVDQPDEFTEILGQDAEPSPELDQTFESTFEIEQSSPTASAPDAAPADPPVEETEAVAEAEVTATPAIADPPLPPSAGEDMPLELTIDTHYRDVANRLLPSLLPQPLTQALLGKILDEGIGRLYLERRSQTGRILWSRDGVLQAVVDAINPDLLQGVINEFKLMMHLSLIPVNAPKQVEIERTYEGQRILLRLRIMPGTFGEEATLQILRGTALRFYQQQQIERLGRDALDAAQLLQQRLNEIRDRARNSLNIKPTRSEMLPTLLKMLHQLEDQVREIEAAYDSQAAPSASDGPVSGES